MQKISVPTLINKFELLDITTTYYYELLHVLYQIFKII